MIYPIVAYGDPVLRKKSIDIDSAYEGFDKLLADMFDTMYASSGVGLAAPQIGKPIRLFVVDTEYVLSKIEEDDEDHMFKGEKGIKRAFINPKKLPWMETNGCTTKVA